MIYRVKIKGQTLLSLYFHLYFLTLSVRDFAVHLGTLDMEATEVVPPMQIISTRNATKHEYYEKDTLMNDIAIIVLPSDVSGQGCSQKQFFLQMKFFACAYISMAFI